MVPPEPDKLDALGAAPGKVTQGSLEEVEHPAEFSSCMPEHRYAHPDVHLKGLRMSKFGNIAAWEPHRSHVQPCIHKHTCTLPPAWALAHVLL